MFLTRSGLNPLQIVRSQERGQSYWSECSTGGRPILSEDSSRDSVALACGLAGLSPTSPGRLIPNSFHERQEIADLGGAELLLS
jgi:hypothetical protein